MISRIPGPDRTPGPQPEHLTLRLHTQARNAQYAMARKTFSKSASSAADSSQHPVRPEEPTENVPATCATSAFSAVSDGTIPAQLGNTQEALFILQDGRFTDCNEAAETLTGHSGEQILSNPPHHLCPKRQYDGTLSRDVATGLVRHALERGFSRGEMLCRRSDASLYDAEISITLLEDITPPTLMVFARDISPRAHAERATAIMLGISKATSSAHGQHDLLHKINDLLQRHVYADSMFVSLLDQEREALTLVYSSDKLDSPATVLDALSHGAPGLCTEVLRKGHPLLLHGEEIDHAVSGRKDLRLGVPAAAWLGVPLRIGERLIGVVGMQHYTDPSRFSHREASLLFAVSEQIALALESKQQENALRNSQTLFNAFMDNIPALAFIKDTRGRYTFVNSHFERYLGVSPQQRLGLSDQEIWPDRQLPWLENDRRVLETQTPMTCLEQFWIKGQSALQQVSKFPIITNGILTGLGGVAFDVTVLQKTRESLEQVVGKYTRLVDNALEGIFRASPQGKFAAANKAMARMLGYPSTESFTREVASLLHLFEHPQDAQKFMHALQSNGSVGEFEASMLTRDGTRIWTSLSARLDNPLAQGHSHDTSTDSEAQSRSRDIEGLLLDITDRKMREFTLAVRLEISETLENVERLDNLYASIHHTLNQYIEARNFFIALVDEDSDRLVFPYVKDEEDKVLQPLDNISDQPPASATLEVVRSSRPLLLGPEDADRFQGTPPRSWLGIPLRLRDKTIGAVVVQNYQVTNCYSPQDVDLLAAAADQAAIGIERRLHREELRRAHDALEIRVRERTAEMEVAKDQAEAAVRAKSRFLANMTHEIRTPIHAVQGMLSLLKDTRLSERQRELLAITETSSENLLHLVNDVLDFSRVEAGKIQFESIDFSPLSVAEETAVMFQDLTRTRPLDLVLDLNPEVPDRIVSDPLRLHQVLQNLLSNAFKFTAQGIIIFSMHPVRMDDTTCTLRFSVQDTGCGIRPEAQKNLFSPFVQEDGSVARNYGGTGLGLSICKSIVNALGGDIWVESTPGKGSDFIFEIDFPIARTVPEPTPRPMEKKHICILDPLEASRRAILPHFRRHGMQVVAHAAPEDIPQNARCDLLYVRAPHKDSPRELAFRAAGRFNRQIPMLVAGSFQPHDDLPETADMVFLDKPVRPSVLLQLVTKLLAPAEVPPSDNATHGKQKIPDLGGLHILVAEDNDINRRVAKEFLLSVGAQPHFADNGQEAVDAVLETTFDLVLMDLRMPVLNGREATMRIREALGDEAPPIVAMTAQALDDEGDQCRDAGMAGFITKPIDRERFYQAVDRYAKRRKGNAPPPSGHTAANRVAVNSSCLSNPVQGDTGRADDPTVLDLDDAMLRFDGDTLLYRDILKTFLNTPQNYLAKINASLRADDHVTAARFAHSLAGAAANLSATRLCHAARRLQSLLEGPQGTDKENIWEQLETSRKEFHLASKTMRDYLQLPSDEDLD
jgi:PAS domain S-box-containing protein